ncbi:MAG: type II toxin-antitoxin system VapC family toxin [Pseudanabaena sp. M090S1SP1A06QC]|jgi:PIN domain nuclease of toxin-antitoxin system|uniref:type II toxin-antitoxin system VapC family toxin n=1 Tax=Pseudanabaena mucicola TaxID=71190 RepID=UPI002574FBF2|nr:type II toxin-antitoxin system VapC family toxin [Pseudanabaena mucicola]MCA6509898.1 type II toxin-antitoxin system VapC family toxin [Pseudanabaena sp. M109S1SP2A07QC]MCA6524293.1 type II toxin-antitoxin system VapC family toxin [Pseudanabaena sp. M051S1SP2A07QC]MCA6603649.1 type II toxin-antitoxin system VapC family toxin [Pseudanabaena sp. M007S1SP1A06QC]MCA6616167.1 type II toxin-antitoxin system VapC family toxin [Pseudanabaena sp. M090S1SP1A06QC]MCA6624803.1 type II toxin-antitoxin s
MTSVVADTHAFIWYILEPERLSQPALEALDRASSQGDAIFLSAISIVEICYLIDKGRLAETVLDRVITAIESENAGAEIISINQEVSLAVRQIPRETVPDMPDRIIAATALHLKIPLVTKDAKIQSANIQTIW